MPGFSSKLETACVGPGRSNFDVESSAARQATQLTRSRGPLENGSHKPVCSRKAWHNCRRCFHSLVKRLNNGEYLCFTYNPRIMKRPSQSKAAKQRHFAWTLRMQHFQVCPWQACGAKGLEIAPKIWFYEPWHKFEWPSQCFKGISPPYRYPGSLLKPLNLRQLGGGGGSGRLGSDNP